MRRSITIAAALLLLGRATAFAAVYPSQVSYRNENGIFEVRKTYEMPVGQEPSMQTKQGFEQDGYSFALTDMLRQELPEQERKNHTETVTVSSDSKELAEILPLLEETKTVVTEDGFTGVLQLDTGSITVEPAGYQNRSWEVSATRTYPGLESMDLAYIPKTTTENGRTLNFSTIEWQTDNTQTVDDDVIGDRFSAIVTYTGTATSRKVTGYTVTARYSGEVEKISLDRVQYVAIFHGTPITPAAEEKTVDWRYIAIPAVLLLGLSGFTIVKIMSKKGGKANEPIQKEDETPAADGANASDDDCMGGYPGVRS